MREARNSTCSACIGTESHENLPPCRTSTGFSPLATVVRLSFRLARKSLAEPSAPRAERAPRPWLLLGFVLVVVLASYLPVVGAPLVWDDVHLIERTPLVQTLHPLTEYFRQG